MRVVASGIDPQSPADGAYGNSSRWRWPRRGDLALLFAFGLLTFPLEARAANPAEDFVAAFIQHGNTILSDQSLHPAERDLEFRTFLLSVTDMKRVALFTLGPYAKEAPEPALAAFVSAFTDLATEIYQRGFASYGQTVRITGSTARSEDDVIVNADSPDPNGKPAPIKIAFRVRKTETGGNVILDVAVQGQWIALSQQQGFTSYLQLHGGDITKLSHELEMRAAR